MDKTQRNWVRALDERHYVRRQLVRIERAPACLDAVGGYVVAVSDLFLVLHKLDPDAVALDGYVVLRTVDVRDIRVLDENGLFLHRALQLKGIKPAALPEIDLTSFRTLLSSANTRFSLILLQREIADATSDEPCYIGRILKLTDKTVTLQEINPAATWEEPIRLHYKDVTRVEFGSGYEQALWLVAEHDAHLGGRDIKLTGLTQKQS